MSDGVQSALVATDGAPPDSLTAYASTTAPATLVAGTKADAMAALQQAGADRLDPVQWYYVQALASRVAQHQGRVQTLLQARLDDALASLRLRVEQAARVASAAEAQGLEAAAAGTVTATAKPAAATTRSPASASAPTPTFANVPASVRTIQHTPSPLAALTQYLTQHAQALESQVGMGADAAVGLDASMAGTGLPQRPELKAVRQFRNTWAKLSADQQLNRALDQAPKNAGPINSHMLVLRSLALMRDISPDYLNRFMSYADALLCLDRPLLETATGAKAAGGANAKKARASRAKTRAAKPE